jgi:hypothetical protein
MEGSCECIEQVIAASRQGVGREVTAPHRKNPAYCEMLHDASDLDKFFGTTLQRKMDDVKMCGSCNTYGEMRNAHQILVG